MKERRFLAEILLGFITRDYRRVAEVHFEAGYVPAHHSVENFAQAIRAIGEPIHNRTAEEISMAKLLTLLLEVTGLFDMRTRPELILLQKTMVVVEGVARGFDPKLDIWKVADPVVREWIERNLGPVGRIQGAMSGAGELGRVLARPAGDRLAVGRRAGAAGDHDPGRHHAVAGDDCGDGPDRGPQEPLAHPGALDHRRHLHRDPVRRPAIVIAMHAHSASIAIISRRNQPMASLTIRKLDDAIKVYLRLRSARNGRSVEEEVRVILGELIQGRPCRPQHSRKPLRRLRAPSRAPRRAADATEQARVTLIIGGGIAAYKALDLIRRLKERHIHVRCVLTRAAQQFVTPLVRQRAVERALLHRPVRSRERVRRRPYPPRAATAT